MQTRINIPLVLSTRFPSGTCLGEWRKNESKNMQHEILYNAHMIYYDVMKYTHRSTCGSMHVSQNQRPASLQIAGSDNKSN